MIAAIPTKYDGVQFRSRLEARWAAFFSIRQFPWEYEPLDFCGWIPDFRLFDSAPLFIEVKPIREFCDKTAAKCIRASEGKDMWLLGENPHFRWILCWDDDREIKWLFSPFMYEVEKGWKEAGNLVQWKRA